MKRILIVDDDRILRSVLKRSLEQQKYQVTVVNSGAEALKAFQQDVPDIIVSDVSMPAMDGFEFCRQLRSQPSGKLVPFIFLSAKSDLDHRIQGHSIGADDYLTKPFEMKELLAKIEALIERSRRVHAEIVHLIEKIVDSRTLDLSVNSAIGRGVRAKGSEVISDPVSSPREPLAEFDSGDSPLPSPQTRSPLSVNRDRHPSLPSAVTEETSLDRPAPLPLTPAEERVFWETIQGFTNKQISERLFISPRTVQTHLSNILNKLNLENRTQLVRFAYEQGYEKVESNKS
jgi:DNA-binding NarL/FixJ family response regulator